MLEPDSQRGGGGVATPRGPKVRVETLRARLGDSRNSSSRGGRRRSSRRRTAVVVQRECTVIRRVGKTTGRTEQNDQLFWSFWSGFPRPCSPNGASGASGAKQPKRPIVLSPNQNDQNDWSIAKANDPTRRFPPKRPS